MSLPIRLSISLVLIALLSALPLGCGGLTEDERELNEALERIRASGSDATSGVPSPSSPSALASFDRECFRWVQLTGESGGLTEQDIRDNYEFWKAEVVPNCQDLSDASRVTCREMRNLGLNPRSRSDLETALLVTGMLGEIPISHFTVAIDIWC